MRRALKLSDYVELAAAEFIEETGCNALDSRWIAAFVQDSGVLEDFPRQDLVAFCALVQKAIDRNAERTGKAERLHAERTARVERKMKNGEGA